MAALRLPLRRPRWCVHDVAFGIILLVGCAIRLWYLPRPLQDDEAITITAFAKIPGLLAWVYYGSSNNHILHTLLVHLTTALFGDDPWAARLPVFLSGVALIPAMYALGRALHGATTGLFAAGLTAGAGLLIEYSTNARGYGLQAFLVVLSFWAATRAAQTDSWRLLLLSAFFMALAAFTIPTAVYACGPLGIWLGLALLGRTRSWADLPRAIVRSAVRVVALGAATGLMTLLLYLPTIIGALSMIGDVNRVRGTRSPFGWAGIQASFIYAQGAWVVWTQDSLPIVGTVLLVAAVVGVLHRPWRNHASTLLALATFVGLFALLIISRQKPPSRSLTMLLPIFLVIAAHGFSVTMRLVTRSLPSGASVRAGASAVAAAALVGAVFAWPAIPQRATYAAGVAKAAVQVAPQVLQEPYTRIVAIHAMAGVAGYYFGKQGVPDSDFLFDTIFLPADVAQPETHRLLVVTDTSRSNAPNAWFLAQAVGAKTQEWTTPVMVADYPNAQVWSMDRVSDTVALDGRE